MPMMSDPDDDACEDERSDVRRKIRPPGEEREGEMREEIEERVACADAAVCHVRERHFRSEGEESVGKGGQEPQESDGCPEEDHPAEEQEDEPCTGPVSERMYDAVESRSHEENEREVKMEREPRESDHGGPEKQRCPTYPESMRWKVFRRIAYGEEEEGEERKEPRDCYVEEPGAHSDGIGDPCDETAEWRDTFPLHEDRKEEGTEEGIERNRPV